MNYHAPNGIDLQIVDNIDKPHSFDTCIPKRTRRQSTEQQQQSWEPCRTHQQRRPLQANTSLLNQMTIKHVKYFNMTVKSLEISNQRKRVILSFSSGKNVLLTTWSSWRKCTNCYSVEPSRKINHQKRLTHSQKATGIFLIPIHMYPYNLRSL